jgi:hypothetical protein
MQSAADSKSAKGVVLDKQRNISIYDYEYIGGVR